MKMKKQIDGGFLNETKALATGFGLELYRYFCRVGLPSISPFLFSKNFVPNDVAIGIYG